MKILLLNLVNNITGFKTGVQGETIYTKLMLEKSGCETVLVSNKDTEHTISFETFNEKYPDPNYFDKIVFHPGSYNFFGGVENQTLTSNFKILAKYSKPLYVLQADAKLVFSQLWNSIKNRGWGYKEEDVWLNNPIRIISQSRKIDEVKEIYRKQTDLNIEWIKHYPIDQYMAIALKEKDFTTNIEDKEFDLVYGGSFRGGSRKEKMVKYFTGDINENYKVELFGTIKEKQLEKFTENKLPSIGKKITVGEVPIKQSKSFSTIILGEKYYSDAMFTPRVWESMLSDAVVLIDEEFDPKHILMPNIQEVYVNSQEEVKQLLNKIKTDEEYRLNILKEQKQSVNSLVNTNEYLEGFKKIIL